MAKRRASHIVINQRATITAITTSLLGFIAGLSVASAILLPRLLS